MSSPATLETVAAAADAVARLGRSDFAEVPAAELPGLAARLATMAAQVQGALVEVAGRLETEDGALPREWSSAKDFLTHVTGGRKGSGAALVRAAARTRELPAVRHALREGSISLAQAGVIGGRVATLPRHDELRLEAAGKLLELATGGYDATEIERSFLGIVEELEDYQVWRDLEAERAVTERAAHLVRFLSFSPDGLGGGHIKGYGSLEEIELVKATLMPLAAPVTTEPGSCGGRKRTSMRDSIDSAGRYRPSSCPDPNCAHDGSDPRDAGARLWDALVEACGRLQATDQLPQSHGTSARLTVVMPYDALRDGLGAGVLESGDSLSAQAVRRLACDAEIIPAVLGSASQVLDVGRSNRLVTSAIWAALVTRDQHCSFPGCRRLPYACDAHHIEHWADGGVTSLDNLALVCRRHHTLAHHSAWRLELDPGTRRPVWRPPPDYYLAHERITVGISPAA